MTESPMPFDTATVQRLSALLADEDMAALQEALLELTLPVAFSKEFINFCCVRRAERLVVLLATLAHENGHNQAWARRVADLYRSRLMGEPLGVVESLPVVHVLRQALADSIGGMNLPPIDIHAVAKWKGSDGDFELAISFLLDHGRGASAAVIAEQRWKTRKVDEHLLEVIKALLERLSRHQTNSQFIHCFESIFARLGAMPEMSDLRGSTALALASLHQAAEQPAAAINWVKRISGHDSKLLGMHIEATSKSSLGDVSSACRIFDALMLELTKQPVPWIQANFKGKGGNVALRDDFPIEDAQQALADLKRVVEEMGEKAFICWGTLLGYARVGNFLSHDKDIDVGIIHGGQPMDILCKLFESGLFDPLPSSMSFQDPRYMAVLHSATGVAIDVNFFSRANGKLKTNIPVSFMEHPRWYEFDDFSIKPATFVDVETFVPVEYERFLTQAYGDWRVSDPYFWTLTDSPALSDQGSLDFLLMARFALINAFAKDSHEHATRALKLLRAHADRPGAMPEATFQLLEAHFRRKAQAEQLPVAA